MNLFYFRKFLITWSQKTLNTQKHYKYVCFLKKQHIRTSLTPQCASHRRVELRSVHRCASHCGVKWSKFLKKLHGVHPAAESSSKVCITPQSQTAHHGVKIEILVSLWLLLKGQFGEILLGLNTSIIKEKNWRIFYLFSKPEILISRCHAHHRVEFF